MKSFLSIFLLLPIALMLISCSLAGDVTPPPGYELPTAHPTEQPLEGPLYPAESPSLARGAKIYARECASCHGETGLGDGPDADALRERNISVPSLGLPEFARLAVPERWYAIVTQGNFKRFMPSFRSLSDSQRWDVVAYALSLSISDDDLAVGQFLYDANCAQCHNVGEIQFTDQARMAALANTMIVDTIVNGKGKMPAFGTLDETALGQLAAYVRSLGFVDEDVEMVDATVTGVSMASETPQSGNEIQSTGTLTRTGTISGTVFNPAGAVLPLGLEIQLYIFDQVDPHLVIAYTATTQTLADGSFIFDGLSWVSGQVIGAALEYQGVLYGSQAVNATGDEFPETLAIEVYESTSDTSLLTVDRHHILLGFDTPGVVTVVEMYAISNPSKKTVAAVDSGEAVVSFPLPVDAENLKLDGGELGDRYLLISDSLADTEPIRPGNDIYQVTFAYTLPYDGKLDFALPVNLSTQAVTVLVPEGAVKVKGDDFEDGGIFEGMPYHRYDAVELAPKSFLNFTLSGQPGGDGVSDVLLQSGNRMNLAIGLGALGLVLVFISIWFHRQVERRNQDFDETIEKVGSAEMLVSGYPDDTEILIDAIIALDDQFHVGKIPVDVYRRRRTELKDRLRNILQE